MNFEQERQALETRFSTLWVDTPIKWPNVHFKTSGLDEFVSLTIVHNDAEQAQQGNLIHLYRYYAFISTQIFVRPNRGSRRAYALADKAVEIWKTRTIEFLHIGVPELVEVGVLEGWFQLNVIHPFYRNEYKTISAI